MFAAAAGHFRFRVADTEYDAVIESIIRNVFNDKRMEDIKNDNRYVYEVAIKLDEGDGYEVQARSGRTYEGGW